MAGGWCLQDAHDLWDARQRLDLSGITSIATV